MRSGVVNFLAKATAYYMTGAMGFNENLLLPRKHKKTSAIAERYGACLDGQQVLPGDVIYVKRMGDLYRHYGIYAGHNRVIHYAGRGGDWGDDVSIHEAPLQEFLRDARHFTVCRFKTRCNLPGYHLYSREETLRRAYLRLGERNYNLITNNCEHFAIWCRTNISTSSQVRNAERTLCGMFDLADLLLE